MRTSEVLHKTADLVQERGWTQGEGGWPGHASHKGKVCLEGGLLAAQGLSWTDNFDVEGKLLECPAYRAVAEYLNSSCLYIWNDRNERTAEEVVEVLRACAAIEAAKEDEALAAEFLTWQGSEISA